MRSRCLFAEPSTYFIPCLYAVAFITNPRKRYFLFFTIAFARCDNISILFFVFFVFYEFNFIIIFYVAFSDLPLIFWAKFSFF